MGTEFFQNQALASVEFEGFKVSPELLEKTKNKDISEIIHDYKKEHNL